MATYTINYLSGDTETVEADGVEYDTEAQDYVLAHSKVAAHIAIVPRANVRSIVRQDNEAVNG
ncbi:MULTISPECIES: hypothetical protein [unclassified Streptomyces]|uniref:hypothetical protein n=1 Tax=unclassified Streptomyces TaxID=2593676 RepID=UPI00278BD8C1|nr:MULTISPECIES: hypothetical protein [unclassified Streptomyces]